MTRFQPRAAAGDDLASESSQLKAQLGKLGLYSMAEQFEADADRAAKSEPGQQLDRNRQRC